MMGAHPGSRPTGLAGPPFISLVSTFVIAGAVCGVWLVVLIMPIVVSRPREDTAHIAPTHKPALAALGARRGR